jgi:hypothetical protein
MQLVSAFRIHLGFQILLGAQRLIRREQKPSAELAP